MPLMFHPGWFPVYVDFSDPNISNKCKSMGARYIFGSSNVQLMQIRGTYERADGRAVESILVEPEFVG